MKAVSKYGQRVLDYVDPVFRKNSEFILELLKITSNYTSEYYKSIIEYIDPTLKSDPEFLTKALKIRSDEWNNLISYSDHDFHKSWAIYTNVSWKL